MHAFIALALALVAPAMSSPRDRNEFGREIEAGNLKQVPNIFNYVLSEEHLATEKNRAKLVTKTKDTEAVAEDNVILESNVIKIVRPAKKLVSQESGVELVRQRRGYNLENVRVPARYPYLAVPHYSRARRWG